MPDTMIPLCRLYQNTSQKTGKAYLLGNLTYTTKIIGFPSEDEHGNSCWQLFIQEREPKPPARLDVQAARPPQQATAQDTGGIDAGDMPSGRYPKPDASGYGQGVLDLKAKRTGCSEPGPAR